MPAIVYDWRKVIWRTAQSTNFWRSPIVQSSTAYDLYDHPIKWHMYNVYIQHIKLTSEALLYYNSVADIVSGFHHILDNRCWFNKFK